MSIRPYIIVLVFSIFSNTSIAQEKTLPTLLQQIEKEQQVIFNYDPSALSAYRFDGILQKRPLKEQLNQLLYRTPYTFDIKESSVLIYLETPTTYRICGTIKDKENNTPLLFSNLFTEDQKQGTQSDAQGNFDFNFTGHKNQVIHISYIGYQSRSMMAQEFNQKNCPDLFLEIDNELFGEEIIVKDYMLSSITEGATYSGVQIDYQKLAQKQTIIEQDILKTVQLIPGVSSIDESATNLQIRGGTPDQNLILWEGATLYDPGHLFGMISAINPYVVEEVQVYKGVYDPSYANRVGGIVDLSLGDQVSNRFHGGLGSTMTEAHAFIKAPIFKDKISLLLSGRTSINAIFNSPTLNNYSTKIFQGSKVEDQKEEIEEGDIASNQQLDFYDLNGKLIIQASEKIKISTSWLKTQNTFNYEAELFEDELNTIDNVFFDSQAWSLSSDYQVTPNWQFKLGFTASDYSNDYLFSFIDLEEDQETYRNDVYNDIRERGAILSSQYQIKPNLSWQVGYDYSFKAVNFNVHIDALYEEDLADINFNEGHFHNVFTALNYQQKDLQINGGLRATYFQEAAQTTLSPRLNIQYALSENLKLKLSGGIFQQYISQLKQFGENALDLNTQAWIIGSDEESIFQSAKKIAGGWVYHKNTWLIDLEGYYHHTDGLSTLGPSFGTSSAATDIDDFSVGSAKAIGLDLLLKKRWRGYQSWLNYSLSSVRFNFPELFDFSFTASNEQQHNLSFVNNYAYKKWNFSLTYQYKTGLAYTNAYEVGEDIDLETFENTGDLEESTFYYIEYDDPNALRLPDYSRLDAGISYRPTFKNTSLKAEITFSMINLFNKTNIFRRDFYIDDFEEVEGMAARPQLFGTDKHLLRRTPLLSVRMYW